MTLPYFAYGSNLCLPDFRRWCLEHDYPPGSLAPIGRAWLPDREAAFTRLSGARGCGVLDVRPRIGSAVPGMLFEVGSGGWEALDHKEIGRAARPGYERIDLPACRADGTELVARSYTVVAPVPFVAPDEQYLGVVRQGLKGFDLDDDHIVRASRDEPGSLIDAVFVYGTLMRGECRHGVLTEHGVESVVPAEAPGALLDLGEFPGLVSGEGRVWGELITLRDVAQAITALDRIEGFRGFGEAGSSYRRALLEVQTRGGCAEIAWVYYYEGTLDGLPIQCGDWRRR